MYTEFPLKIRSLKQRTYSWSKSCIGWYLVTVIGRGTTNERVTGCMKLSTHSKDKRITVVNSNSGGLNKKISFFFLNNIWFDIDTVSFMWPLRSRLKWNVTLSQVTIIHMTPMWGSIWLILQLCIGLKWLWNSWHWNPAEVLWLPRGRICSTCYMTFQTHVLHT